MNKNQLIATGILLLIPSIVYIVFKIATEEDWKGIFIYIILPILLLISLLLGIALIVSGIIV